MAELFPSPVEEAAAEIRRRLLPVIHPSRPVDVNWTCQKSGDCCTLPKEVVMTKEEAANLVHHAPPTIKLVFRPTEDSRFVALKANPCPLFVFKTCLVYEHRPYNCRRFACMRPDPKSEPWAWTESGDCANLWDRLKTSSVARHFMKLYQRKAQKWARKWGWVDA